MPLLAKNLVLTAVPIADVFEQIEYSLGLWKLGKDAKLEFVGERAVDDLYQTSNWLDTDGKQLSLCLHVDIGIPAMWMTVTAGDQSDLDSLADTLARFVACATVDMLGAEALAGEQGALTRMALTKNVALERLFSAPFSAALASSRIELRQDAAMAASLWRHPSCRALLTRAHETETDAPTRVMLEGALAALLNHRAPSA